MLVNLRLALSFHFFRDFEILALPVLLQMLQLAMPMASTNIMAATMPIGGSLVEWMSLGEWMPPC